MTRRTIYVSDELWEKVEQIALEEGVRRGERVPVTEIVRDALEREVEREEKR